MPTHEADRQLKKQVEAAATMEEKKNAIENAGMLLDDDELSAVAGGELFDVFNVRDMTEEKYQKSENLTICPICTKPLIHQILENGGSNQFDPLPRTGVYKCKSCNITWNVIKTY